MKKMLVIFLILFTKVLADSNEDKYVDLLPDEEKQQFLENVARRIFKDVESQENITGAKSGEVSENQLKQHTKYVKSILKEEQGSVKHNKGDVNDESSKSASEEKEVLGLQSLTTEKTFSQESERGSEESASSNITVDEVTDNAPIIKRSIEDGSSSKMDQSEESSETPQKTSQNNTLEESNEIEAENEKFAVDTNASDSKVSFEKDTEVVESTTAAKEDEKAVSVEINQNDDARNVSVKALHESRRRNTEEGKLSENTTDIDTTTSTVEFENTTENKLDEYSNVSSAEGEFTTPTYPSESGSLKGNTTESTTLDDIVFESTTEINAMKENDSEPQFNSKNDSSKVSETEVEANTTISTHTLINEETTESVLETTDLVPETTNPVTETTTSVIETTEFIPETTTESEIVMTEALTESTTVILTTQSIPVVTTEKMNIIIEDFTSASTSATTVKPIALKPTTTTEKNKITDENNQAVSLEKVSTAAVEPDEESIEATTIKHRAIVYKPFKVIVGPKAKKMAEAKQNGVQNNNFIELEKVYFDNNYKTKVGNEYHVFEIPAGQTPFTVEEAPIADQPYYVPVYNYAPNNAYFNPQNRLGPNAVDASAERNDMFNDDYANKAEKIETLNVKMEYDTIYGSKRKKFGGKKKLIQSIYRQPTQNIETQKAKGKVNPEDYVDSDYYFGRVRKAIARDPDFSKFPNSDEADHPAHSLRKGTLKDHVRAVRNLLFQQKSFGLLEKDKYGTSVERVLRMGRKQSAAKKSLRHNSNEVSKHTNYEHKQNNYKSKEDEDDAATKTDFDREIPINKHIQKVGYLKKHNETQELYVMDDFFKSNVEKFIKEKTVTRAPSLSFVKENRHEIIAILKREEKSQREEEDINDNKIVKKNIKKAMKAKPDQDEVPVDLNQDNVTKDIELSLRRNEVVKVSVYLQVLKDMVTLDDKALVKYNWLGTTVDIQAALQKLFELTSLVANKQDIHPSDMEILKYILFIHKLASEIIEANDFGTHLRKKLVLPRDVKKNLKARNLKEKGLINKVWLYLRKEVPEVYEQGALQQLNLFLIGVEDGLYDLHVAINNVAKITKYKNQHWYQNLKDLYLNTDKKNLLELLLHMTSLRLFTLIEESANNGLEDDYLKYMKQNRQHCKRTLEEMMFIMEILEEYNKFLE